MKAPVTAIIPTRDRPELLRRAIRSMAEQTVVPEEVIVVYDGTKPEQALAVEFPELDIRGIPNTRTPGLCGSRNTGILAAATDWVAFCDDDDEWLPRRLASQLDVATEESVFVTGGITIDNGKRTVVRTPGKPSIPMSRLAKSRVMEAHSSTFLIRRSALLGELGLVDEAIPGGYYEDYDILLRAARLRPVDVVDESVAIIHWHPQSLFRSRWEMSIDAIEYLIEKTPEIRASRAGEARLRGQQAFAYGGLRRRTEALAMAKRTFRLDPRQLRTYMTVLVALTPLRAESLMRWANAVGRGI